MSDAHALIGQVALVLGFVTAAWSVGLAVLRRPPGTVYLGGLVWVFITIAIASAIGLVMVVSGQAPDDVLHAVYGVLALAVLPGAVLVASGRDDRGRTIVAAVATVVLAILLLRLVATGG